MKEDIKKCEELIEEMQKDAYETAIRKEILYGNGNLKIEIIKSEQQKAIESLLKAYKQDEEVIDLMANYIWKYDCCNYEIGKDLKCEGYYLEEDCKEKCIKEYFRKKAETNE